MHTDYDHKKDKWKYVYFPIKVRSKLKLWLKERQNLGIKGRELFPYSKKPVSGYLGDGAKKSALNTPARLELTGAGALS